MSHVIKTTHLVELKLGKRRVVLMSIWSRSSACHIRLRCKITCIAEHHDQLHTNKSMRSTLFRYSMLSQEGSRRGPSTASKFLTSRSGTGMLHWLGVVYAGKGPCRWSRLLLRSAEGAERLGGVSPISARAPSTCRSTAMTVCAASSSPY